jgi:hypothetical protein
VTVQDSSRPPDVRPGVADSTSLVGGLSKKEEAGSCCFVLSCEDFCVMVSSPLEKETW